MVVVCGCVVVVVYGSVDGRVVVDVDFVVVIGSGVVDSGVVGSDVVGSDVIGSGVVDSGVVGSGVVGSAVVGSSVVPSPAVHPINSLLLCWETSRHASVPVIIAENRQTNARNTQITLL